MDEYTLEQRLQIIKIYYKSSESIITTLRALRPFYGRHNVPAGSTIRRLVQKFESTYSLHNVPVPVRQRGVRTPSNVDAVRESVKTDPNLSVAQRSQLLGIPQSSLRRILKNDLNLHAHATTHMHEDGNQNDDIAADTTNS